MQENVLNGLLGGLGGLLKSVFGAVKNKKENPDMEFNFKYTAVTVVEGAIAGIVLGYALGSPIAAFLSGAGIAEVADLNDLFFPKNLR